MTSKFDTMLSTTEVVDIAKTTRVTAINWMRNWEVNGLPLGVKRGGRWFAFPDRLIKFLQGQGSRRKNGKKAYCPAKTNTDEA